MIANTRVPLSSACRALPHGNTSCRKRQDPLPHLAAFAAYVTPSHRSNPHKSRLGGKIRSREIQNAAKTAMFTIPVNITAAPPHILCDTPLFLTLRPLRPLRFNFFSLLLLQPLCSSVSSVVVLVLVLRRSLTPFRPSTYTDLRFLQRRCDAAPPPSIISIGARRPRAASPS